MAEITSRNELTTLADDDLLFVRDVSDTSDGAGGTDKYMQAELVNHPYIMIQEQQAQGTAGGGFTSGAWQTRVLNTEVVDTGSHASLSSNQITLTAGTYLCYISAPAVSCGRHQTRLQNVTDATTVLTGSCEYLAGGALNNNRSITAGRFTIAASKALEVQHRCEATKTVNGFGVESNWTTEVYTIAEFIKVG